jgi:hypothetical protein
MVAPVVPSSFQREFTLEITSIVIYRRWPLSNLKNCTVWDWECIYLDEG